jgi:hypothetical protein
MRRSSSIFALLAVAASRVMLACAVAMTCPGVFHVGPHPLDVGLGGRDGRPRVLDVGPHLLDVGALVEHLRLGALEVCGRRVDPWPGRRRSRSAR